MSNWEVVSVAHCRHSDEAAPKRIGSIVQACAEGLAQALFDHGRFEDFDAVCREHDAEQQVDREDIDGVRLYPYFERKHWVRFTSVE